MTSKGETVLIKKYANRRLYDTESSSYVTLEHLAEMVRAEREFKVVDAKSGEDITHTVLTQIIVEQEAGGNPLLPVAFLRQLIGLYGNSMQGMVPSYLEASLEAFQKSQTQMRDAIRDLGQGAFTAGPFAQMAKRNMDMFAAATGAAKPEPAAAEPVSNDAKAELAEVKAQLAALQSKLDKLGD